jgi:UDP-N-acetylmuramate--L-alanine ligase/UDP-N-acetylenolpyruvoylglucosamine reductase
MLTTKQQLIDFLAAKPRRVHFIGIGGVGMSGLARLLIQQGHAVTGSDAAPNGLADALRALGAKIHTGHAAANLPKDAELVVFTSAVTAGTNTELDAAETRGLPCVRRGLLLTALMNHKYNVAVAGTHGKTTTTSMIAHVLMHSDSAPSFCVGAHVPILGSNAQLGAGKYFVAEACESDGTLINFTPEFAVCLNIEAEHLDHHGSMEKLLATFETFYTSTLDSVIYCADCANSSALASKARHAISFGLAPTADYHATDIEFTGRGTRFTVVCRQQTLGVVELIIPGKQNVSNALAAIAVADQLGMPFEKVAAALGEFTGAKRRFERKHDANGIVVVDDYAHHPTEIKATLAAARTLGFQRVVVAFQPHRYTRTKALRDEFATAFTGADKLFLTEVYAASETPIPGVGGETVRNAVVAAGQANVVYEPDLAKLTDALALEARRGDLILVMGAGDIYKVAAAVAERFAKLTPRATRDLVADFRALLSDDAKVRSDEPMSRHTSMRVGGPADLFVEPRDEHDLAKLLHYCHVRQIPVTVIGRGTNLLVRDGGIAGVVVHLEGAEFTKIEVNGDRIVARGGARLKAIAQDALRHEVGGLEFMHGIPGSLGGALRMNAGAMGRQTFDVVEWVRYVSFTGEIYEADAKTVPVTYRNCPLFRNHIALSATLRGVPTARAEIEAKMRAFDERRTASQPRNPNAGCVFKNPETVAAGKLIDELGLKGTRVGGACVSDVHANFIVNDRGATAADVLELIGIVRDRVRRERGIELETEVMILGREL